MSGGEGRRGIVIAIASTVVFFTLLAVAITHAPGWPEVRRTFFDWDQFKDSLPEISRAFLLNVKIFSIAEAFILVFALLLAVMRSPPGPAAHDRQQEREDEDECLRDAEDLHVQQERARDLRQRVLE